MYVQALVHVVHTYMIFLRKTVEFQLMITKMLILTLTLSVRNYECWNVSKSGTAQARLDARRF